MPSPLRSRDEVPELAPRLGVEAGGRLVEEEQLGAADDAERDVEPTALPAGEVEAAGPPLLGEPDRLDHLVDVARVRVVAGEVAHRLLDGEVAEVARRSAARCRAGCATRRSAVRGVGAEHVDVAAVARAVALEDLGGRGLAGAVGAEQGEHLAAHDVEVDAVDGLRLAVRAAHAPGADRQVGAVGHRDDECARIRGRGHGPSLPHRQAQAAANGRWLLPSTDRWRRQSVHAPRQNRRESTSSRPRRAS